MFDTATLSTNTENPTLLMTLLTVLLSLLLSASIAFTYEKTSRQVARPDFYIQALVLIALVAAMIMQAIGDNFARGLGMIGALSIIRFRTTLRNPRNITFMFAALASGIGCGVFAFTVAALGTLAFCATAFLLYATPFSNRENLLGTLTLELAKDSISLPDIKKTIKKHSIRFSIESYRLPADAEAKPGQAEYRFLVKLKKEDTAWLLTDELNAHAGVSSVSLRLRDTLDVI